MFLSLDYTNDLKMTSAIPSKLVTISKTKGSWILLAMKLKAANFKDGLSPLILSNPSIC